MIIYGVAFLKLFFRRWILDAVPAIGTPVAVKFIKEKFLLGEVTTAEGAQALLAAVQLVKADLPTIELAAVGRLVDPSS